MSQPPRDPTPSRPPRKPPGGLVHTYLGYDPQRFPGPRAEPPDLASAAFDHMLAFGSTRRLTPEQLADAVHLDPSEIAGLGPSLDALIQLLEERKRKILETYETRTAHKLAGKAYHAHAASMRPPEDLAGDFRAAVRDEQIRALRRLWYRAEREDRRFAADLLHLAERLGEKYEIESLAAKYTFTGRTPTTVDQAIEIKEELEAIDRLLEQLREAMKNAKVGLIDLEELSRFVDEAGVEELRGLQQRVEEYLREEAERQGIEESDEGYRLTPRAYRLFQGKLLEEIFSSLDAARSGRHSGPIEGEGAVEMPRTRPYEFGDTAAHMDVPQSVVNAMLRGESGSRPDRRLAMRTEDIEVYRTRNNPKCATCVLMDMSGSMRYGGQYINAKRMALALDGLIRTEYPGDFLRCLEIYTVARPLNPAELASTMPKPVTIHEPVVRLMADMSRPDITESMLPPHFTNIQHGLRLARQFLAAQDTPNRQVMLITDGLPTAHFDGEKLYMLYPPDPATEEATMREAFACRREGITINIFLLPSWSQSSEDVQFAQRIAETTSGRVFFTGGDDLDRFVLWDYVNHRRKIIG